MESQSINSSIVASSQDQTDQQFPKDIHKYTVHNTCENVTYYKLLTR